MITLTPLSGPYPAPLAYLLTVDNARILLDCGAPDHAPEFAPSTSLDAAAARAAATAHYLRTIADLAPTLSLVLLTHPLLESVGLLAWLRARCGLRCPVYGTLPTREMGRWAVEEWVDARSMEQDNPARAAVATEDVTGTKKRTKGKGKELAAPRSAAMEVDQEDNQDPWHAVWQVSKQEIREAFLAVNAIRWTQPIHLSGASLALLSTL